MLKLMLCVAPKGSSCSRERTRMEAGVGGGRVEGREGGGREAYSLVACLSHLTIGYTSFSARSTVPTPSRDTSSIWALNSFVRISIHKSLILTSSPSFFAICGHHLPSPAFGRLIRFCAC